MSGGRFGYKDLQLKDEMFGFGGPLENVLEDVEISELVWEVLDLIHKYDWYSCGDASKEGYLKAKSAFKQKWFGDCEERTRRIVDEAVQRFREELYETFLPYGGEKDG